MPIDRPTPSVVRRLAFVPALRRVVEAVQGFCFWTAVAIPFLYLPLLALGGIVPAMPSALFGLVGANLVALVVGHGYDPRRRLVESESA